MANESLYPAADTWESWCSATASCHFTVLLALATTLAAAVAAPAAAQDHEGPVVGMPPVEDAVLGWGETWAHPDYWSSYVYDAVVNGHVNLPYPTDPVKPEAYLPNVPVADGRYVSSLPVNHQDLSRISYEWNGQRKTIEQFMRTTRTDGVVFVVNGTVIGERYANGYSAKVRHQPWSVTKTFVAAVVGVAYDEGRISSLSDPIDRYLPRLKGTAWEGVTIENLLQMESGVHWDEGTPVLALNTQVQQWVELALDLYTDGALGKTRNEFLADLPPSYKQGTKFSYNSGNTQVLAWLTEKLYGTTFNKVISEKLWKPMGAGADAVMTSDRVGGVVASHGLFARPYDFARFGELLRSGGRTPEGRRVVSRSWVKAMTTMTKVSDGQYGYQTWAHPIAGKGAYSASGFQGQKITVVPDACLTGVRLSHALGGRIRDGEVTDPDAYAFDTEFYAEEWQTMLRAVAKEFGTCSASTGGGFRGGGRGGVGSAGGGSAGGGGASGGIGASGATAPTTLPATGGGAALVGVALLGLAVILQRTSSPRRRRSSAA